MSNNINLKQVLMELGNRLVTEEGYDPPQPHLEQEYSTTELQRFTEWLNTNEPARRVLAEMGYNWPVTPKPKQKPPTEDEIPF